MFNKFRTYKILAENQTQKKILKLRNDNGGEYISNFFTKFCNNSSVAREFIAPYTPQQNGGAEKNNRTLVESARYMSHQSNMLNHFGLKLFSHLVIFKIDVHILFLKKKH